MSINFAYRYQIDYKVNTPVFEGPLDLLLQLIEHQDLDITKLSLAKVTDQYLEYLEGIQEKQPAEVSAFLVIAAKLIQIKSELLLPQPSIQIEEEEDLGEALARQLRIYKQFKEVSLWLDNRQKNDLRTYRRIAPNPEVESRVDLNGISLAQLVEIAKEVFSRIPKPKELGQVVEKQKITIREKIKLIVDILRTKKRGSFFKLLSRETSLRLEVVVTFLALLELSRRRLLQITQDQLFDDIEFEAVDELGESQIDFDLEFGE